VHVRSVASARDEAEIRVARALLKDLQMPQWGTRMNGSVKWDRRRAVGNKMRRIVMVLACTPQPACEKVDGAPDTSVATPSTPLEVIQTLLEEPIESVVIYRDAGWADGMYELLAEEFPSRRVAVM
jgi:hypothetical protein